ncbi:MAG: hypothetical protein ACT4PY_08385 [Armatimonadota bacterium]
MVRKSTAAWLVLAILAVGSAVGTSWGGPAPTGIVVAFQTVDTGQASGIREPNWLVIRDTAAWAELWQRHAPGRPAPSVDFSRDMVVGVFTGVSQDSSGIWITRIVREPDRLTVFYSLVDSKAVPMSQDAVPVLPFHIVRVPRTMAPVWFALIITKR